MGGQPAALIEQPQAVKALAADLVAGVVDGHVGEACHGRLEQHEVVGKQGLEQEGGAQALLALQAAHEGARLAVRLLVGGKALESRRPALGHQGISQLFLQAIGFDQAALQGPRDRGGKALDHAQGQGLALDHGGQDRLVRREVVDHLVPGPLGDLRPVVLDDRLDHDLLFGGDQGRRDARREAPPLGDGDLLVGAVGLDDLDQKVVGQDLAAGDDGPGDILDIAGHGEGEVERDVGAVLERQREGAADPAFDVTGKDMEDLRGQAPLSFAGKAAREFGRELARGLLPVLGRGVAGQAGHVGARQMLEQAGIDLRRRAQSLPALAVHHRRPIRCRHLHSPARRPDPFNRQNLA